MSDWLELLHSPQERIDLIGPSSSVCVYYTERFVKHPLHATYWITKRHSYKGAQFPLGIWKTYMFVESGHCELSLYGEVTSILARQANPIMSRSIYTAWLTVLHTLILVWCLHCYGEAVGLVTYFVTS